LNDKQDFFCEFVKLNGRCKKKVSFLAVSSIHRNFSDLQVEIIINLLKYPALHALTCDLLNIFLFLQFSKMCTSAFRVSDPPGPDGGGSRGQTCTKTFLRQVGMSVQNFIKNRAWVWISICPPHTHRQTNKHLYAHFIHRDNT